MTPERLAAIRADAADVEKRAGRIATWRAMPHRFAVESGLRTQGLRAPRLAVHLRDLLAEVQRLQEQVRRVQTGHDCAIVEAHESGLRTGQEAMRERAEALCRARADRYAVQVEQREPGSGGRIVADARSAEAEACADAIRALEVSDD
jgi:hypothetical protein